MASIELKGGKRIECGKDQAYDLQAQWFADTKNKAKVLLGERSFLISEIKQIFIEGEQEIGFGRKTGYNLKDEKDRKIVKGFAQKILKMEQENQMPVKNAIDFFGGDYSRFQERNTGFEKRDGWVFNELLGLVHWTLVDWAMSNGIIGRYESDGGWDEGKRNAGSVRVNWAIIDANGYWKLVHLVDGWRILRSEESFFKKQDTERLQTLQFGAI